MTPTDAQWAAVKAIVAWYRGGRSTKQVFYLAGYAGTGKSTIFKLVLKELQRYGMSKHVLCTFTGKAASVLRKKGNEEAQTIHSAAYIADDDGPGVGANGELVFQLNLFGAMAEADLIALDECSMVDEPIGKDVLSFGRKVLVMGDPGQLPPVQKERGEGFFTKMEPDVFLDEVHRQALDSPILRLATMAREGKPLPICDWKALESGSTGRVLKLRRSTEHLVYRLDTQPICGIHRVRKEVTRRLRHTRGFGGSEPMPGERILCLKNNRQQHLFNGLQGDLLSTPAPYKRKAGDDEEMSSLWTLDVQMDDHEKPIKKLLTNPWAFQAMFDDRVVQPRMKGGVEWFDFGYLLTAHKAQGSEWDDVTIIDDAGAFREDKHRWRYTSLTRASEHVTLLVR